MVADPDPTPLWLWLDVESTGLLDGDQTPAVLETAWMVTTSELRQLTPLRVRLAGIAEAGGTLGAWPRHLMAAEVAQLHAGSGLQGDWESAPAGWRGTPSRIGTIGELDGLIAADLDTAFARIGAPEGARIHLAGAGVAQFEARLLPQLGSSITRWCHYRAADTSVAAMVAGIVNASVDLADGLTLDVPGWMSVAAVGTEHRAGTDVRAAYATARHIQQVTGGPP